MELVTKSSESIVLYHSTSVQAAIEIGQHRALIGSERLGRDTLKAMTLTPDRSVSTYMAGLHFGRKVTFRFQVPVLLIASRAPIISCNAEEFSTTQTILASNLPENYLKRISLTRDEAMVRESTGRIRFYELSLDYLKDTYFFG